MEENFVKKINKLVTIFFFFFFAIPCSAFQQSKLDVDTSSVQNYENSEHFSWFGRFRSRYYINSDADYFGESKKTFGGRSELRLGIQYELHEKLIFRIRYIGRFSTTQDRFRFTLSDHTATSTGIRHGESTIDEFNITWNLMKSVWIQVGRMQVSYPLRGALSRGLNRYDKSGAFTDGFWVRWGILKKLNFHFVAEYNSPKGASTVARPPLTFVDPGSRVTYWSMLQHQNTDGLWTKREFSMHYIPHSFSTKSGEFQDYITFTTRMGIRVPLKIEWVDISIEAEGGYVPHTPSCKKLDYDAAWSCEESSYGWQGILNLENIDFFNRSHNFGLHYGQTEPGWLTSPNFKPNQKIFEGRYQILLTDATSLELRYRHRREFYLPKEAQTKQKDNNFYIRITYKI